MMPDQSQEAFDVLLERLEGSWSEADDGPETLRRKTHAAGMYVFSLMGAREKRVARPSGAQRSLGVVEWHRLLATHKLRLSVPPDFFTSPRRSLGILRLRRISLRQAEHVRRHGRRNV